MIGKIHIASILLVAVAVTYGTDLVIAPNSMPMGVGEAATPNHDPHHVSLAQSVATPNHDPHHIGLIATAATPNHDPHPVSLVATVATPNHDMNRVPAEMVAWEPVTLRAEPDFAAPSAPVFAAADAMLYARANARLRAAPSTAAGVVTKLTADTPLRAIARSTDGVWWQVALAASPSQQGRTGYVRRDAVTKARMVKAKPPAAPTSAPVPVATAFPPPAPAPRSQGPLAFVSETVSQTMNQTMDWLVGVVGRPHGSVPKIVRAERTD